MQQRVHDYIQEHSMVTPGDLVIVAVSGGPDSVALLHVLHGLAPTLDIRLHVFHLDHGLRGAESEADAVYVHDLAAQLGWPCTVIGLGPGVVKRRSGSLQANARAIRYEEMTKLAARIGAASAAVAQHRDDQAETVLMRLLRGTGPRGLSGIAPVKRLQDLKVIRPLLPVSRQEIERYCTDRELSPRLDASNLKQDYLRNRIRLSLVPTLAREYNPAIRQHLAALAEVQREEDKYLDSLVIPWVRTEGGLLTLDSARLTAAPLALSRRAIRLAARRAMGEGYELGLEAITKILGLVRQPEGSVSLDLPEGLKVIREYGNLRFQPPGWDDQVYYPGEWPVDPNGITEVPEIGLRVEVLPQGRPADNSEILLDLDNLPGPLLIRFRRPGDRLWPKGMEGSKKLQDILVDAKVPRRQRDRIPILTAGEDVLWVIGYRYDRRYLAGPQTTHSLRLRVTQIVDSLQT